MTITRTDIDEYWENCSLREYNHYLKLKRFGWSERDIEWGIIVRIIRQRKEQSGFSLNSVRGLARDFRNV